MYVYGMFRCDEFKFEDYKNINNSDKLCITSSFDKNKEYTYFMMSEYIQGMTLQDCIFNMYNLFKGDINKAWSALLSWIIQIFKALEVANYYMKYTHYDLHTNNIMIRSLSGDITQEKYVYYSSAVTGIDVVIKTYGGIPTIIDYGYSTVVDKEGKIQDSKLENVEHFGVKHGNRIGHDIYKLSGFIAHNLYMMWIKTSKEKYPNKREFYKLLFNSYNKNILNLIRDNLSSPLAKKLIEPNESSLGLGRDIYYSLPIDDTFGDINISKLFEYINTKNILFPFSKLTKEQYNNILNMPDPDDTFENFINNSVTRLDESVNPSFKILLNLVKENNWIVLQNLLKLESYKEVLNEVDNISGKTLFQLADEFEYREIKNVLVNANL